MSDKYIVLGAGGHARVIIDALGSAGREILAALDAKPAAKGRQIDGVPILGGDEVLEKYSPKSVVLANGVGGAESTAARQSLFERLTARGWRFPPVVAASAHRCAAVRLDEGCQVLTNAVVHPGSSIGVNTVINTAVVIEHDCVVGAHAFVGPGTVVCGGARLADGAFVGAGAVILPGRSVGAGAIVAAGAVVHKDVPAGGKALGGGTRLLRPEAAS